MADWNPWHGCHKLSEGCKNCYVYRTDSRFDKDSSIVTKNSNFNFPVKKTRNGNYKIASGETVFTCFTSDFFLEDADDWRVDAWKFIKERSDLNFFMITKRIDRFNISLPEDWNDGYSNVTIGCTVENQIRADYRLPIFRELPIKNKYIICEPLLSSINFDNYLDDWVNLVAVGGESGQNARICDYEWVLEIRRQCIEKQIPFYFKQTGANFKKDGKVFFIERKYQHSQARKANLNFKIEKILK